MSRVTSEASVRAKRVMRWCDGVMVLFYSVAPTVLLHTLFPHSVAPYTVSHSHHRGSIWTVLPPTHFYTLSIRGNRLDGFHMLSLKLLHPITHTARVIPVLLTCVLIVLSLTHKFSH